MMKRVVKGLIIFVLALLLFACPPGWNPFAALNITGLLFTAAAGSIHTAEMFYMEAGSAKGIVDTGSGFTITQDGGGSIAFTWEDGRPPGIDSQHAGLDVSASAVCDAFVIEGTDDNDEPVEIVLDGSVYAEWNFPGNPAADTYTYTILVYTEGLTVTWDGGEEAVTADLLFDVQFVWDDGSGTFDVAGSVTGTANGTEIDEADWVFDFTFEP